VLSRQIVRVADVKSLFDIQVNGFASVDFQSPRLAPEETERAVAALAHHGTLRFFPTLITDDVESLRVKFENLEQHRASSRAIAEAACGYHLEGPWISPEPGYRGAHEERWVRPPSITDFDTLQKAANGNIRLVTLAPEWPDSPALIKQLVAQGVHVSLGHTNASESQIDAAIEAGARFCTHLGNGVPQMLHRHDNVIQRLLARDELVAFLIPDGIHLPPAVLKNFFRAKPPGKALFTTDCMSAAGAPPGRYRLADTEVEVGPDRIVRKPGETCFAGSSLAPDEGVENLQRWLGLDPETARALFSTRIAELFGIDLPDLPTP
jgi:N-acetylglucosamine-6-phosphate deacetylase